MPPKARSPIAIAAAPLLVILLSASGPFDGCSGGPEARPLPADPSPIPPCFTDLDCTPDSPSDCRDLRCIAGVCTEVAPIRDGDGDRFAAAPCGDPADCDDTNGDIAPGAAELCDLIDQDCDGAIDEMAPARAIRFEAATIDPQMVSLPWGDDVLVTDAAISPGTIRGRLVSIAERRLSTSLPIHDLGDREVVAAAARAVPGGGTIAVIARSASGDEIVILSLLRRTDGGAEISGSPIMHPIAMASAIALAVLDGVPYVAWDEGSTRRLWSPSWAADVEVGEGLVEGLGPLDLASDGTHLVLSSDPRTLAFHRTDGTRAGTRATTGDLATGRPLADDDGGLWAIVRDAFDYSVQRVTLASAGALSTTPDSDVSSATLLFGAERLGTRLYFTRGRADGASVSWAEIEDLGMPTTLPMREVTGTPRGPIRSVEVIELPAGPLVVTNYGDAGSAFTLLACRAPGS